MREPRWCTTHGGWTVEPVVLVVSQFGDAQTAACVPCLLKSRIIGRVELLEDSEA